MFLCVNAESNYSSSSRLPLQRVANSFATIRTSHSVSQAMDIPWLLAAESTAAAEPTVAAEPMAAEPPPFVGASLSEKAAEFRAKLANMPEKAAEFRAKLAILVRLGAGGTDTPSVAFTSGSDTEESLRTPQNGGMICVEIEPGVDSIVGANYNQLAPR
jgi:hypothetical protein